MEKNADFLKEICLEDPTARFLGGGQCAPLVSSVYPPEKKTLMLGLGRVEKGVASAFQLR